MINSMVLVDYKKAFDMVDHVTLLRKLDAYNIISQISFYYSETRRSPVTRIHYLFQYQKFQNLLIRNFE